MRLAPYQFNPLSFIVPQGAAVAKSLKELLEIKRWEMRHDRHKKSGNERTLKNCAVIPLERLPGRI
jgi:hypothetical protein